MAIGRISGEMLEQNLNLTGNLTFNGDALTIASDGKIGIKNTTPGVELDVTGTARANTVTVLGDLSMEWTITMDAQDNLNFAYNGNTLISYDSNGNISGSVATELELLTDVDFTTNTPTTTSGLVLTSDGDSSYSFQPPVTLGDNQKEFVATGAISAGEVVSLRNDGTVEVTQISTVASVENSYTSSLITPYDTPKAFESAYDSVNNRLFIATIDGASQEILTKIGSISNSVITFGSTISTGLYVSLSVGLPRYKIAYDETTDQLVIAYNAVATPFYTLRCQVGTVSGNSITWSNAPYYQSSYPFHITDLVVLPGKSQVVINWIEWNSGNHSIKAVVGNLGNNSVTLGTSAQLTSGQVYDINYCKSVYIPTVTWSTWGTDASVAIFYSDANPGSSTNQYIYYVLYGINSNGDLSQKVASGVDNYGGPAGNENKLAVHYDTLTQRLVVAMAGHSNTTDTKIFTSELPTVQTAIGFSTGVTLTNMTGRTDLVLFTDTTDNLLKFAYSDSATGIQYFSTLTIGSSGPSGTPVTVNYETALTQTSTSLGLDVNIINNDYVFTHDGLGAGSNEVGSTVYEKSYNTSNADSWIGIAAEDIADTATGKIDLPGAINRSQTGLVKDTIYYVSSNGALSSTKTEYGMLGKAISDTDLQIFGNTPNEFTNSTDIDFVTNTPTTTSGLVLTSDGDSSYSFQPAAAESTYQENYVIATGDGQTVFSFNAAFEGYNSTTPANSHLEIYWNGSRLMYGANHDYTISANNQIILTSGTGILTGDIIFAISISNMTLSRLYTP